jgi:hypothetical protein
MKSVQTVSCPHCGRYYTPQQLGIEFAVGKHVTAQCATFGKTSKGETIVSGCKKHFDVTFGTEDVYENQLIPGFWNRITKKTQAVKVGENLTAKVVARG